SAFPRFRLRKNIPKISTSRVNMMKLNFKNDNLGKYNTNVASRTSATVSRTSATASENFGHRSRTFAVASRASAIVQKFRTLRLSKCKKFTKYFSINLYL